MQSTFALALGTALLVAGSLPLAVSADTTEPNILLVIADDMGLDASNCYDVGNSQANMPNIEKLCASGLVFDNAYAAPVCSPTRSTIMTGQFGFRTGVGAAITKRNAGNGLSPDETSLFDVLSATRYSTNVIGKWHLANDTSDLNHPNELGVPNYFGLISGGTPDYFNWQAVENGELVQVSTYSTTELTNRSIDWIAEQTNPWFLWLAYNAPHAPFHLPPADLHTAHDLKDDKSAIKENPLPYYNAMLEALDTEVGRLLDTLSAETRENTVVIFIGDNGTPGQISSDFYGNKRSKGSIYEGGTHIPFVVQGPGFEQGRSPALVNTTDLFSTIAELAGATSEAPDSISLLPISRGDSNGRENAYIEHFSDSDGKRPDVFGWAIRDQRYKLVAVKDEQEELYDLQNDPLEKNNLLAGNTSASNSAKADELRTAYKDLRK